MLLDLPPEILAEIFLFVVNSSTIPLENHRAPAKLIPVCRRFKELVYGFPDLWTTVVLSERGGFRHLPFYLGCSGSLPIDVTMYPIDEDYKKRFVSRAAAIVKESRRWRTLVIGMVRPWLSLTEILPSSKYDAPLLSSVSIWAQGLGRDTFKGLQYAVPSSPGLTVLGFGSIPVDLTRLTAITGLRTLSAGLNLSDEDSWINMATFLNLNPSLKYLTINAVMSEDDQGTPFDFGATHAALPTILSLALGVCNYRDISLDGLVRLIDAPLLSEVSFKPSLSWDHDVSYPEDIVDCLSTCILQFPSLRTISIFTAIHNLPGSFYPWYKSRDPALMHVDIWVDGKLYST